MDREEVCPIPKMTNWEERIEHKINMLFEEILDLRNELEHIRDNFLTDKIKREKKELENQLEDKMRIIQSIDSNYGRHYSLVCEKRDRFNGVGER